MRRVMAHLWLLEFARNLSRLAGVDVTPRMVRTEATRLRVEILTTIAQGGETCDFAFRRRAAAKAE